MKPLIAAVALSTLVASGCLHERLDWRRPDGSYDPERLAEDVRECEEFDTIAEHDGDGLMMDRRSSARAYGGWGSFPFEFCMEQRGWVLTRVRADRAE